MKKLYINNLKEEQVITSYNLARNCDIVYAEALTPEQFSNLDIDNARIYYCTDNIVIYKLLEQNQPTSAIKLWSGNSKLPRMLRLKLRKKHR